LINEFDVFISYSRADKRKAESFEKILHANNITYWRDYSRLENGMPISFEIDQALLKSSLIVIFWSTHSIRSAWVQAESLKAYQGKKLVPALIDSVDIPVPFNIINTYDLTMWQGKVNELPILNFVGMLGNKIKKLKHKLINENYREKSEPEKLEYIKSPLVGTFLRSENHGQKNINYNIDTPQIIGELDYNESATPLIRVGDKVTKGQAVASIFTMSYYNLITSEYNGTIYEILVNDNSPVGFGDNIISIIPK